MRKLPIAGTIEIAPSILSADFSRLADHIHQVENEVQILHIDIMDGHFVPNITIGPVVVKKLRPHFDLFFDTHLMISDAPKYAPEFIQAGSDGITFHLEAVDDPKAMIQQLRDLKVSVGVSIKPKTPASALKDIIAEVDMVLLMTVEPGFGGQDFIPESLNRARELRKMKRQLRHDNVFKRSFPFPKGESYALETNKFNPWIRFSPNRNRMGKRAKYFKGESVGEDDSGIREVGREERLAEETDIICRQ